MPGGGHGYIRADHYMVPDVDIPVIGESQMEIRIDMIPQKHMPAAPVRVEGRFDVAPLARMAEHFLDQTIPFFHF